LVGVANSLCLKDLLQSLAKFSSNQRMESMTHSSFIGPYPSWQACLPRKETIANVVVTRIFALHDQIVFPPIAPKLGTGMAYSASLAGASSLPAQPSSVEQQISQVDPLHQHGGSTASISSSSLPAQPSSVEQPMPQVDPLQQHERSASPQGSTSSSSISHLISLSSTELSFSPSPTDPTVSHQASLSMSPMTSLSPQQQTPLQNSMAQNLSSQQPTISTTPPNWTVVRVISPNPQKQPSLAEIIGTATSLSAGPVLSLRSAEQSVLQRPVDQSAPPEQPQMPKKIVPLSTVFGSIPYDSKLIWQDDVPSLQISASPP
jgi:hypothetical protein